MSYKRERTCKCILDYVEDGLLFHKGREYQVDVYPIYNQIYQNGGWNDYIFMQDDEMNKYFKLID